MQPSPGCQSNRDGINRRRTRRERDESPSIQLRRVPTVSRRYGFRLALLTSALFGIVGCCLPQAIQSTLQPIETMKMKSSIERRARMKARKVWKDQFEQRYLNHPCASDVRQGFMTGFVETAFGLGDCPPPVPSRPLISKYTFTHTYPNAIPWYEGYNFGNAMAVAHGVDQWRLAPINPDLLPRQANCCVEPHVPAETIPMTEPIPSSPGEPIEELEELPVENPRPRRLPDIQEPTASNLEFSLLEELSTSKPSYVE